MTVFSHMSLYSTLMLCENSYKMQVYFVGFQSKRYHGLLEVPLDWQALFRIELSGMLAWKVPKELDWESSIKI